jgi:protein SCO1
VTLRQIRRVLWAAAGSLALLLIAGSVLATTDHEHDRAHADVLAPLAIGTALERPKVAPDIPLVNANGQATSLNAYRGKWVVLAPSMTLCQEVCPMTTGALVELQQSLAKAGLAKRVEVVEATVDPWRDTPSRLRAYAKLSGLHFIQLTGTRRNIHRLWKFFGVFYERVPEGHPADVDWLTHRPLSFDIDHTDAVFIIDPAGQLRVVDDGMPKLAGPLSKRLRALLDSQGRQNLAHPELPWTAADLIDDLDFEMNREIPASQAPQVHPVSLAAAKQQLKGSPRALAELHDQASELIGGIPALTKRLAELRGHPIVLNIWASWCPPCRAEYPLLATASARYGRQVAFLGVDVNDSTSNARAFLKAHPVSYPSYDGASDDLGALSNGESQPVTVFISATGKIVDRYLGAYDTLPALENDIEHYSLKVTG